jgi:hypothetical protein
MRKRINPFTKQSNKKGMGKKGNKNDWKCHAPLHMNTEYKWLQCPNQRHRIAN